MKAFPWPVMSQQPQDLQQGSASPHCSAQVDQEHITPVTVRHRAGEPWGQGRIWVREAVGVTQGLSGTHQGRGEQSRQQPEPATHSEPATKDESISVRKQDERRGWSPPFTPQLPGGVSQALG